MAMGKLIEQRPPPGFSYELAEVRIYTGRPDPKRDRKSAMPHMKQCAVWERTGATVITRPLRYPSDWPKTKAQEKGVDVALAIDFVTMPIDDLYDVGVIGSTDTDLRPAMEYVHNKFRGRKRVEVLNWDGGKKRTRRLGIPG